MNAGTASSTETGTDSYTTLNETGTLSGVAYSQNLTGVDTYTTVKNHNSLTGLYTITTTGADSSTGAFSSTQTGNANNGTASLVQTGADRYVRLSQFNDTADGATGGGGMADYSPVGMPVVVDRASVPAGTFTQAGDAQYEYCFAAGTLVLMADGSRKAIERIEVGEMVMSVPDTDPEAEPRASRVLEVYRNAPAGLLEVGVAGPGGGAAIFVTAEHPFYVLTRSWTKAADLRPGQLLRAEGITGATVASVTDSGRREPVFNLRVGSAHTYFVCSGRCEPAVLVHNASRVITIQGPNNNTVISEDPIKQEGNIAYAPADPSMPVQAYRFSDDLEKEFILQRLGHADQQAALAKFAVQLRTAADAVAAANPIIAVREVVVGKTASDQYVRRLSGSLPPSAWRPGRPQPS